jgi:hypothetical protein
MRLFLQVAHDAAIIFLALGCLGSLVFGAGLALEHTWAKRLSEQMNRWVSTRRAMRSMAVPHDVQRQIYRRHQFFGLVIIICATYVLYMLLARYNGALVLAYASRYLRPRVAGWLLDSLHQFVLITNAVALVIGLALLLRPSMLKGIEAWANRSYSTRGAGKSFEVMNLSVDQMVLARPRASGVVIIVGSLLALTSLAMVLFSRG